MKGPPTHRLSCGQSPYTETTTWERKYCILTDSQLVLLNREKEVREAHVGHSGFTFWPLVVKQEGSFFHLPFILFTSLVKCVKGGGGGGRGANLFCVWMAWHAQL